MEDREAEPDGAARDKVGPMEWTGPERAMRMGMAGLGRTGATLALRVEDLEG